MGNRSQYIVLQCLCGTAYITRIDIQALECGTHWKLPEARIWDAMKRRCYNKNWWGYKYYGGRGIKVCKRWKNSFVNFLNDMGKRPKNKTLDRINNNRNYSPGNCRWATAKQQSQNRRICAS